MLPTRMKLLEWNIMYTSWIMQNMDYTISQ